MTNKDIADGICNSYKRVNLPTYLAMKQYNRGKQAIRFVITYDEVKNFSNTVYYWNGVVMHYAAEIQEVGF